MHAITHFTEGIRAHQQLLFQRAVVGCALGEKVIGLSVVQEVISIWTLPST